MASNRISSSKYFNKLQVNKLEVNNLKVNEITEVNEENNYLSIGKEYLIKVLNSVKNRETPVDILEKDINNQYKQWELCDVLEECLLLSPPSQKNKNNGLPLIFLNEDEKFWLFRAFYYFLPIDGFSFIIENISSSEILKEVQFYAIGVDKGLISDTDNLNVIGVTLPIFGNINNPHEITGYRTLQKNELGLVAKFEPRGLINKFIKIFGDLESNNWGFRYSGHHFDINFQINNDYIKTFPVFRGYNPLIIPTGPSIQSDNHDTFTSLWSSMSGIDVAPSISIAIENLTNDNIQDIILLNTKYNSGNNSQDGFIGMTKEGAEKFLPINKSERNIYTYDSKKKQDIWNLIKTTLDIVTNNYNTIKNDILNYGQFGWSYNKEEMFTYFRIESDKYLFQALLSNEFTAVESRPTRALHYHSQILDKSQFLGCECGSECECNN